MLFSCAVCFFLYFYYQAEKEERKKKTAVHQCLKQEPITIISWLFCYHAPPKSHIIAWYYSAHDHDDVDNVPLCHNHFDYFTYYIIYYFFSKLPVQAEKRSSEKEEKCITRPASSWYRVSTLDRYYHHHIIIITKPLAISFFFLPFWLLLWDSPLFRFIEHIKKKLQKQRKKPLLVVALAEFLLRERRQQTEREKARLLTFITCIPLYLFYYRNILPNYIIIMCLLRVIPFVWHIRTNWEKEKVWHDHGAKRQRELTLTLLLLLWCALLGNMIRIRNQRVLRLLAATSQEKLLLMSCEY